MEDRATVGLPIALGGKATLSINGWVVVCADRCAVLPVVDSCPCYWGTPDQRIVNLSHTAWGLVSDMPLEEGLIDVRLYLTDTVPSGEAPSPMVMSMEAIPPAPPPADQSQSSATRTPGATSDSKSASSSSLMR